MRAHHLGRTSVEPRKSDPLTLSEICVLYKPSSVFNGHSRLCSDSCRSQFPIE